MRGFLVWVGAVWRETLTDQWAAIQAEIDPEDTRRVKVVGALVLVACAVCLTLLEYRAYTHGFLSWALKPLMPTGKYASLNRHIIWSLGCFTCYFVLPSLLLLILPGERIRDYGLSFRGFGKHIWIYVLLFLIVMPAVIVVSYAAPFMRTYPFYKLAHRSVADFLLWQVFYIMQFFALEFFFRGFLLKGLKRYVGAYAIFFMAVPYCMIHFGKPMAETLGAVIAGIALGTLALRTGSIWSGVLIHASVAVSMDLLSMWQNGRFG